MDLDQPQLASFDYRHESRIGLSGQRKLAFVATLLAGLLVGKLIFPVGLVALVVPAIIYLGGRRTLRLGPRYLICGDQIIYYANVTELKRSAADGTLSLQTGKAVPFVVERRRFRSSGGNQGDLAAHQAVQFDEVSATIADRVRRASCG